LIKKTQKSAPLSRLLSFIGTGLVLLAILGSVVQSTNSFALKVGTDITFRESHAGNIAFELIGGSFRDESNSTDRCSIVNSSSMQLNIPIESIKILKAYLYWTGSSYNGYIDNQVKINGEAFTADRTYSVSKSDRYFFNGVKDITSYVANHQNTNYEVTELDIATTGNHCDIATVLGGWAVLVIYEHENEDFRVLNLYEGFQYIQNDTISQSASNFILPQGPRGQFAHITWEGDDNIDNGEDILIGSPPTTVPAPFDSASNVQGGFLSYGVDLDEYDISSYLTAGDSNLDIIYRTGQDLVFLSAEVISVSNIPVADLAVTTSTPLSLQANSTITKKFTITNNGPNDVPALGVSFSVTLPSPTTGLTFNGTVTDADWSCTQTSASLLDCTYQPKLRSGWSDYIDIEFNVGDASSGNQTLTANVHYNNSSYEIFDNVEANNTYTFIDVPVTTDAVIDLSASSKTYSNVSGDLLLAGDTLQYTITIADASGLAANNITVVDDLPGNISSYTVLPPYSSAYTTAAGSNGSDQLTFSGITLLANTPEQIFIDVVIDSLATSGALLQNNATISQGGIDTIVDTGNITLVDIDLSASTKTAEDVNTGRLLPNETARYIITLDDNADNLDITGLQITDHLPAYISSFTVSNLPSGAIDFSVSNGGDNSTGYIDIRNIDLAANSTLEIYIDITVANDAPDGADLTNTATIALNNATWEVISNDLIVSLTSSTPSSGNKPLYFENSNLTRNIPNTNTSRNFSHDDTLTWILENNLNSDLTLADGDISINLVVGGYRTGGVSTDLEIELFYSNAIAGEISIASQTIANVNYRENRVYDMTSALNLTTAGERVIPKGSSIYLKIKNISGNGGPRSTGVDAIDILSFNGTFYSKVVLNALTVINVDSISVWDATYGDPTGTGDGTELANSLPDTKLYIRAVISDPFGAFDINKADISIENADGDDFIFSDDSTRIIMAQVDDTANDTDTHTKTFEKEITLVDDESIGYWVITVKGYEGREVTDQVTHESALSFRVLPFLPITALSKTINVVYDPINIEDNPKAIPGALIRYTINVINTGRGKSDDNSIILQDEIPENSELFIGDLECISLGQDTTDGPVCYQDTPSPNESGLAYDYDGIISATDDVSFSINGTDFNYEPVNSGGFDSAIRYIRITPTGFFNKVTIDGTGNPENQPEFNFSYQIRLN